VQALPQQGIRRVARSDEGQARDHAPVLRPCLLIVHGEIAVAANTGIADNLHRVREPDRRLGEGSRSGNSKDNSDYGKRRCGNFVHINDRFRSRQKWAGPGEFISLGRINRRTEGFLRSFARRFISAAMVVCGVIGGD